MTVQSSTDVRCSAALFLVKIFSCLVFLFITDSATGEIQLVAIFSYCLQSLYIIIVIIQPECQYEIIKGIKIRLFGCLVFQFSEYMFSRIRITWLFMSFHLSLRWISPVGLTALVWNLLTRQIRSGLGLANPDFFRLVLSCYACLAVCLAVGPCFGQINLDATPDVKTLFIFLGNNLL